MIIVEPVLEVAVLRVELVQDWVHVAGLVVREDRNVAQLGHFLEELTQVGPLVDENFIILVSLFLNSGDLYALRCLDTAKKFFRRLTAAENERVV